MNPVFRSIALAASCVLLVACQGFDPNPEADQEAYVGDVMAFTRATRKQVLERMVQGGRPLAEEWLAWEKQGPMTEERMKAFYKQTTNYIYDLGRWHLWVPEKRASDVRLVEDMKALGANSILDFGGGVGFNALMLADAGFDVTLADLESASLDFAQFRAQRRGVKLAIWKTDIEPMPRHAKYDVILALDVLEHLPRDALEETVGKLVKLKHARTRVVISAPFGRTASHPMHLDATEHTRQQVQRLRDELPPG
jgi:2-polyprenyl-3-methyl-5-hydroxy-6-metoxy-1,4-benzoquinol methylase